MKKWKDSMSKWIDITPQSVWSLNSPAPSCSSVGVRPHIPNPCMNCHKKKLECEGLIPCLNCKKLNQPCYSKNRISKASKKKETTKVSRAKYQKSLQMSSVNPKVGFEIFLSSTFSVFLNSYVETGFPFVGIGTPFTEFQSWKADDYGALAHMLAILANGAIFSGNQQMARMFIDKVLSYLSFRDGQNLHFFAAQRLLAVFCFYQSECPTYGKYYSREESLPLYKRIDSKDADPLLENIFRIIQIGKTLTCPRSERVEAIKLSLENFDKLARVEDDHFQFHTIFLTVLGMLCETPEVHHLAKLQEIRENCTINSLSLPFLNFLDASSSYVCSMLGFHDHALMFADSAWASLRMSHARYNPVNMWALVLVFLMHRAYQSPHAIEEEALLQLQATYFPLWKKVLHKINTPAMSDEVCILDLCIEKSQISITNYKRSKIILEKMTPFFSIDQLQMDPNDLLNEESLLPVEFNQTEVEEEK